MLQAEVDELKGELEEEQFLSSISAPVEPPSQPALEAAPEAPSADAVSEAALEMARSEARTSAAAELLMQAEVERLKAVLATAEVALATAREETRVAHAEARLFTEAERAATGAQVEELKAMLATARDEAREVALASAVEVEEFKEMLTAARDEVRPARMETCAAHHVAHHIPEAEVAASGTIKELRALEEARTAREEARVAREVARVSTEAKVVAIGTINGLRTLVAQLEYKLEAARDLELRRTAEKVQWVTCHVALGEYEEAERLGWDGEHPSPPMKRSVNADETSDPVRDSASPATQRPPQYRRTRSINTAARASPPAIRARSHSPEYRQQSTPDWLRAAVTVQPEDDIDDDSSAAPRGDPHQDMLELVRDVEACRQWVAYHVARGEYKDAVELGWDGTNPLALTVQELIEASIAAYAALKDEALSSPRDVSVEVFPRSPATCTTHASPSALLCPQPRLSRDECIEVTARPLTNPQLQNMIEVAAYAPTSSILPSSMETSQLQPAHSQLVDEHPVHLTILERQASFLKSAKENERLEESVNNAASARVNERLERARKHNWHVAKMAAASTTVGRHARGHLTRVRLRREGEAARMSKLQRETERAWAKT